MWFLRATSATLSSIDQSPSILVMMTRVVGVQDHGEDGMTVVVLVPTTSCEPLTVHCCRSVGRLGMPEGVCSRKKAKWEKRGRTNCINKISKNYTFHEEKFILCFN